MPYYPYAEGREGGHQYTAVTWFEHLVAEYSGLNFAQIDRLNYYDYLILRRDAFICKFNSTEAGQEYLDNAWRMEQTEPDREGLRKKYGKKEGNNGEY